MKILTKEDRYIVYCILLAEAKASLNSKYPDILGTGFCYLLNDILNICVYDVVRKKVDYDNFKSDETVMDSIRIGYPELHKFKPKNLKGNYWFDRGKEGWKIRIGILEKITKKLEKELYGK